MNSEIKKLLKERNAKLKKALEACDDSIKSFMNGQLHENTMMLHDLDQLEKNTAPKNPNQLELELVSTVSQKPFRAQFGWQDASGINSEGLWGLAGGEAEYLKALEAWELDNQ